MKKNSLIHIGKNQFIYMGKLYTIPCDELIPKGPSPLQTKVRQLMGPHLSVITPFNSKKNYYLYHKIRQDREELYKKKALERLESERLELEKALNHTSPPEKDDLELVGQDTDSSNSDYCTIS